MAQKPFLVDINLNDNQLLNASLQNLATHPSTTGKQAGWIYWNTADDTAYIYTGGTNPTWLDLHEMYQHPDYTDAINNAANTLTGARVISRVQLTNGHVTNISTRDLTAANIGAALADHDHNFADVIGVPANTILANNTGSTSSAKAITASQLMTMMSIGYGTVAKLETGTDTLQSTWSAKQIADYVDDIVTAISTVSNLSVGTRNATTLTINNSNGTNVVLPSATTTQAGLMASADKTKLNGIAAGANNYTHPTHSTANDFSTAVTSGLKVLSKVSVAANGHVTEIKDRTITAADIAAVMINNAINNGTTTTWSSSKIQAELQDAISQAQTGALQYKGEYNPATNTPDITEDSSIEVGYTYVVNANGTFAGEPVESGDMIIAKEDNPGDDADNWQIVNKNIPAIVNASTTVRGIIELATSAEGIAGTDNTRAVTPAVLKAVLDGRTGGYAANFGDGASTDFTITHGLATQDVTIQIQRVSDRREVVMAVAAPTNNTVTIGCNVAPTSNEYRVIIKK